MKMNKLLALVAMVGAPMFLAIAGVIVPKVVLILVGLALLGVFVASATLIGIAALAAGVLFLLGNVDLGHIFSA